MSALEEIQRAILKLELLKTESDIGVLDYDSGDATLYAELDPGDPLLIFRAHEDSIMPLTGEPDPGTVALAELLATLHRTIDAQLAILKLAANVEASEAPFRTVRPEVKLARAINGTV